MKRGEIESDFANHLAEGMDWETMYYIVVQSLRESYEAMSDEDLKREITEYAPHLLED